VYEKHDYDDLFFLVPVPHPDVFLVLLSVPLSKKKEFHLNNMYTG
jgi:hypothetical protein